MPRLLVGFLVVCLSLAACEGDKKTAAPPAGETATSAAGKPAPGAKPAVASGVGFEQKNSPDNLKALVESLLRALAARDEATFTGLLGGLQPDEATVKKGLRDGLAADAIGRVLASARQIPTLGAGLATAEVHGATGSEIKEQTTLESGHFSGNDRAAAEELLRPDMKYYNVRVSGGGEEKTLHLFFWDGAGWKMLGHIQQP
jgi:hypothetical protein